MAKVNSCKKGKRSENAIIAKLQPAISSACKKKGHPEIILRRNLEQSRDGGVDVVGTVPRSAGNVLTWCAIEVKDHQQTNVSAWWRQCVEQARDVAQYAEPILIFKHQRSWKVMMFCMPGDPSYSRTSTCLIGTFDLESFLLYFEKRTMAFLTHGC